MLPNYFTRGTDYETKRDLPIQPVNCRKKSKHYRQFFHHRVLQFVNQYKRTQCACSSENRRKLTITRTDNYNNNDDFSLKNKDSSESKRVTYSQDLIVYLPMRNGKIFA